MPIVVTVLLAAAIAAYWYWLWAPAPREPQLQTLREWRVVAHGGRERRYLFVRPASAGAGAPAVLVLHASGGDARSIRRQTGYRFDALAAQHGFVVIYPEGIGGYWNDCRRAGRFAAKRLGIDDVGFLRALVGELRQRDGVGAVCAAGFSNGGHMCFRLALEAPEMVSAIAVYGANLPTPDNCVCHGPTAFVPALLVNGTRDPINPYAGGHVSIFGWDDRGMVHPSAQTVARLAAALGPAAVRTPAEVVVARGEGATSVDRQSIAGDAGEVALYTVHGGGHAIPQPRYRFPRIVGRTERRFDAPAASWELFARAMRVAR